MKNGALPNKKTVPLDGYSFMVLKVFLGAFYKKLVLNFMVCLTP
jgi:hypothetical protein